MKSSLLPLAAVLSIQLPALAALPIHYDANAANADPAAQGWTAIESVAGGDTSPVDGLIDAGANVGLVSAAPDPGTAWQIRDKLNIFTEDGPGYSQPPAGQEADVETLYNNGFRMSFRVRPKENHNTLKDGQAWSGFVGVNFPASLFLPSDNHRLALIFGVGADNSFLIFEEQDSANPVVLPAGSAAAFHTVTVTKAAGVSTVRWFLDGAFIQTVDLASGLSTPTGVSQLLVSSGTGPGIGGTFDLASFHLDEPGVIHVDAAATGTADGSSWANAYPRLRDALAFAVSGDEIRVAAGTYYPDEGGGAVDNDRASTFSVSDGVTLFGGFAGTETDASERDPAANPTVLCGDLDQDDGPDFTNRGGNAYHVLSPVTGATVVIDGFTVTGGNADQPAPHERGGGLTGTGGSITLDRMHFTGNSAETAGGAIYLNTGSLAAHNNVLEGNRCTGIGGALCLNITTAEVKNTFFLGNHAGGRGGAGFIRGANVITNAVVTGNTAGDDGAAFACHIDGGGTLVNTTITRNDVLDNSGTALDYFEGGIVLKDCIVWNNDDGEIDLALGAGSVTNLVEGGPVDGSVIILDTDPQFTRAPDPASGDFGDLRPTAAALRDAGTGPVNATDTDISGERRLRGDAVDPGAYEIYRIHRVDIDTPPGGNGNSWPGAYKFIQYALSIATSGDEIWVAEGTYPADRGPGFDDNNRARKFSLVDGVSLYGGFSGSEEKLSERSAYDHPTILSGEIDDDPSMDGNSYHVVYAGPTVTPATRLDGFTLSGGNAVGAPIPYGGAMLVENGALTVSNCVFNGSQAEYGGGFAQFQGGLVRFFNCAFHGNLATNQGGGVYLENPTTGSPVTVMVNCTLQGNQAATGGGLVLKNTFINLANSVIYGNGATTDPSFHLIGIDINLFQQFAVDRNCIVFNATNGSLIPEFANALSPGAAPTTSGDLRPLPTSDAVDFGDISFLPASDPLLTRDLASQPRVAFAGIDAGAYEFQDRPAFGAAYLGSPLASNGPPVELGILLLGDPPSGTSLAIRNLGDSPLSWSPFVFSGTDAALLDGIDYSGTGGGIGAFAQTSRLVTLSAATEGTHEATLEIANNDPDRTPFLIPFTWRVISGATDTDNDGIGDYIEYTDGNDFTDPLNPDSDGDGIKDGAEEGLAVFGLDFVNGQDDSALKTSLQALGPELGLYTASSIEAMAVTRPVISRDPATGKFTIQTELLRSPDLVTPWATFPDFTVEKAGGSGELLLEFDPPSPGVHFFQISVGE